MKTMVRVTKIVICTIASMALGYGVLYCTGMLAEFIGFFPWLGVIPNTDSYVFMGIAVICLFCMALAVIMFTILCFKFALEHLKKVDKQLNG